MGCASYVVADGGEAAIIDPRWEIGEYLRIAQENGFRISHVLETHNHADHLSGKGRLVEATGAKIYVGPEFREGLGLGGPARRRAGPVF